MPPTSARTSSIGRARPAGPRPRGPAPPGAPRPPLPGGVALVAAHRPQGRLAHRFDRRQEAGLLVVVVAVEGAARDPREGHQIGDGSGLVALVGDRPHPPREEPLTLIALRLFP